MGLCCGPPDLWGGRRPGKPRPPFRHLAAPPSAVGTARGRTEFKCSLGFPRQQERNRSGHPLSAFARDPGKKKTPSDVGVFNERATRFELATLTLAR
jgi:hypothetical protein